MGPCLFISEAGCMMGNRLDHRTETAHSVAHLATASSIRQHVDRPPVALIHTKSSHSGFSLDGTWPAWGHLPSIGIIHFLNRGLYPGWCKSSVFVCITCKDWWITMEATRDAISCHISVFRLGAEPKATQVLMSFKLRAYRSLSLGNLCVYMWWVAYIVQSVILRLVLLYVVH